jgi:deoxyribodipyrimidine photo-lyase
MPIIHWFRRDLRILDNTSLFQAARDSSDGVVPVFVFDDAILKRGDCGGPIVQFMLGCLEALRAQLQKAGGDLVVRHGVPVEELGKVAREFGTKGSTLTRITNPPRSSGTQKCSAF